MRRKIFEGYIKNIGFQKGMPLVMNAPILANFYKETNPSKEISLIVFEDNTEIYSLFKNVIFYDAYKFTMKKVKIEVELFTTIEKRYLIKRLIIELE